MKKSTLVFLVGLTTGVLIARHNKQCRGHLDLRGDNPKTKPKDFSSSDLSEEFETPPTRPFDRNQPQSSVGGMIQDY